MERFEYPLISIITINYNQTKVTCEFLKSLKQTNYPHLEVVVVDNASDSDPSDAISACFPEAHIIISETNLGFSGGNNLGIRYSQGEYIFVVNNDTEVPENFFKPLLNPFELDSSIGIVSPKIKFYDQPELIQYAGFSKINPFTGRNYGIGEKEVDRGQFNKGEYTPYAHGAAMLVKRKVIEEVGVLPEHFFLYYEELDFSVKTTDAGYTIYYQPEAEIFHKESVSVGKESTLKAYYLNRNRMMFMERNSNTFQYFCFLAFFYVLAMPKAIMKYALKLQCGHLRAYFRAIAWNFKQKKPHKNAVTKLDAISLEKCKILVAK